MVGLAFAACIAMTAVARDAGVAPDMTATQIIQKNATARGGVEAWSKIQTMAWAGHVESPEIPGRNLAFVLEQKRPASTRFQIVAENQKSLRIYDGANGWKVRPGSGGMPELQPYTADELNFAHDAQVITGPLMDDVAKDGSVELSGADVIEGRKAYVLTVRLKTGATHRIWVDAETFLEVKYSRDFRTASGQPATASVTYRNYQTFQGLQIPLTIEGSAAKDKAANKIVIERVALNPQLDERMFGKPSGLPGRRNAVVVDTRHPMSPNQFQSIPKP
jgi:outer membrane lipoprotein-sorting protein